MNIIRTTLYALALILVGACSTIGTGSGSSDAPLYYGYGTGTTVTQGLSRAKQHILRQVIDDVLDDAVKAGKKESLTELFYQTERPNGYFYLDTLNTVSHGKDGEAYAYRISVRVNLSAVVSTLVGNSIYGGLVLPDSTDGLVLPDRRAPADTEIGPPPSEGSGVLGTLSTEDRAVLLAYLESLTFLVYFNDSSGDDPFLMKAAAAIANRYLAEESINLVDLERVETIKKDQELAFEAQTGQAVSLIQWIAQKLNADVYVEIDAETSTETDGGKFYGQANVTMKFFESSTAVLLASVPYRSPKTFSSSSELDALNNAIQSSVYQAMPIALEQVYERMRRMSVNGIPYELTIQQTPDARLLRDFVRRLEEDVEKVETVSQSAEETRYRVYLIGEIGDLQDIIFDIADLTPGLGNMELVYLRGKSITFASGM